MSPKSEAKDPRRERLARALRENLKRRKAQIRGRAENAAGTGEQVPVEQALVEQALVEQILVEQILVDLDLASDEQASGKQAAGARDFEDQVSGKVSGQKG
ncbi:MAG: hypothetical protein ABW198_03580 [Pseudorhodoplanes sp.]